MRARGSGRIVNVGSVASEPRLGLPLMGVYGASKAALHALSIELNKELAPLGILCVLCEAGVGGRSAMHGPLHEGVAAFGGLAGAHAVIEGRAASFAAVIDQSPPPDAAAVMIADACTTPAPGVRYPADAQAGIDGARAIADGDYLALCRGGDVPGVTARYAPAGQGWLI